MALIQACKMHNNDTNILVKYKMTYLTTEKCVKKLLIKIKMSEKRITCI